MKQKHAVLTGEQLRLFYQRANTSPDGEIFLLMICTGMRVGELLALHWQDLDMQARTLIIQRTIHAMGPNTDRPLDRARVIQLPPALLERLRTHRAKQQDIRTMAGDLWAEHGVIFATSAGGYVSLALLRRRLHRLLSEVDLSPCSVHVIRNSTIALFYALGIDPLVIHTLVGFKLADSATVNLVSPSLSMGEDAIQRLINYLSEEKGGDRHAEIGRA
ncbi:tyrosine-type recombinase/integrase [Ktedonobacter robiniae]|uniref:Tyr recombinase domain-containing protein n=1 Tax=Ktedonobacter robiniae TaxID=2778365 RepID=A0ABQ3UHH0_9CHLR|nr:tyrosine-type recombinase/integrase [Ktedonobacter robiniae]GHO52156.1 hypothetical protein KSB_06310 [Ktedonobacter robiniae]